MPIFRWPPFEFTQVPDPNEDLMKSILKPASEELSEHIEAYAAAFLKSTNLQPDQVVMKIDQSTQEGHFVQKIWFEPKEKKNVQSKIYAGLDADAIAKLFFVDENGVIRNVYHKDWLAIADILGLQPGEMPLVYLKKENDG